MSFEKIDVSVTSGWILSLAILTINANAQETNVEYQNASSAVEEAMTTLHAVYETIAAEHISPPTKQQAFLSATKAIYGSTGAQTPDGLPELFSHLSHAEDFNEQIKKAWRVVETKKEFDSEFTLRVAARAMLQSSGIPSGRLLTAKQYRVENSLQENQYVGIGIQLEMNDGQPMITKPIFGGTAHKAGSIPNDFILSINDKSTQGESLQKVVDRLRGPLGSTVKVELKNRDSEKVRTYELKRETIPIPSVEGVRRKADQTWDFVAAPNHPEIAYIKFASIVGSTAAELNQAGLLLRKRGFKKAILDFRNVRHCDIHHAVMLADSILDERDLGEIQSRNGTAKMRSRPGNSLGQIELAVLANPSVDGPLYFLLSNLKNRPNTIFVGTTVRSAGIAVKLIELPNGLGAIAEFPNALCHSSNQKVIDETRMIDASPAFGAMFGHLVYEILPDSFSGSRAELIPAAIEQLSKEVDVKYQR